MLLLDEPLGALDLKLREQMQEELKALQKALGITFIFVTHDQGEALSMADRVAVFNDGRVMQVGTPERDLPAAGVARSSPISSARRTCCRPSSSARCAGEKRWASLRPEAIHGRRGRARRVALTGTVTSRSYLGAGTRLAIDLNGTQVHAVVPSSDDLPGEGERVTIGFSKDALHLMESGE